MLIWPPSCKYRFPLEWKNSITLIYLSKLPFSLLFSCRLFVLGYLYCFLLFQNDFARFSWIQITFFTAVYAFGWTLTKASLVFYPNVGLSSYLKSRKLLLHVDVISGFRHTYLSSPVFTHTFLVAVTRQIVIHSWCLQMSFLLSFLLSNCLWQQSSCTTLTVMALFKGVIVTQH